MAAPYFYLATSQKPTAVFQSLVCQWTSSSAEAKSLVIARGCTLEVHEIGAGGLSPLTTIPLFGRLQDVCSIRPPGATQDVLFVLTDRRHFCILAWDSASSKVLTKASGNLNNRVGREVDQSQCVFADPHGRMIGLYLYEGTIRILPVVSTGGVGQSMVGEAFDVRLADISRPLDIKFLCTPASSKPTLCVLYEDNNAFRHIKTFTVDSREKELSQGPWQSSKVSGHLILPINIVSGLGGILMLGQNIVTYANATEKTVQSVATQGTVITACACIDDKGARFLYGDEEGNLWVLVLQRNSTGLVTALQLDLLGLTTIASTITYLSDGVVFLGSNFGDSKLIRLTSDAQPDSGAYFEELETYVNIGPILDMVVVNTERQGLSKLVTCSGAYKDGSLCTIRSGIGISEHASLEMEGVKGTWALRRRTPPPLIGFW